MKRFRFDETYEELRAAAFAQADLFDPRFRGSSLGVEAAAFDCHCTD